MPRLYLVIFLIFGSSGVFGQNNLPKFLDFAQKQYDKGDYYYALVYYEKALNIDSNTVDILWNYAETLRAYKDYRKAELYYNKVYEKESGKLYPASLLNLGLMQKQNGKYDEAIETFKLAKKKYYKNKKGYLYKKSKRELESTIWATSAMIDSEEGDFDRLPETVNTVNSEFGHGIYNDELIFSSLRADSINGSSEEVYSPEYSTSIFRSKKTEVSFDGSERIKSLFMENLSTGNGSFSLDGSRFYFSLCAEENFEYRCKIMVAQFGNGKWFAIDSLGSIINEPGSNTTMPCIANLSGQEALI
ncbi:MAG: tetratricopeptide repeat protein, partial [Crocinitomicaceae bacterium]